MFEPSIILDPHPLSPWGGPILVGCVTAVTVQSFFAYRIWVLSEKKSWWLCLMILLVSPLYFKYSPDTAPQRVSLWIVLRRQWNIRGCCEYLCGLLPKQCLFQPNLNLHIFLAASDGTPGLQMPWDVDFGTGKSLCQRETYIHGC